MTQAYPVAADANPVGGAAADANAEPKTSPAATTKQSKLTGTSFVRPDVFRQLHEAGTLTSDGSTPPRSGGPASPRRVGRQRLFREASTHEH
eukprot:4209667-Prymnesium_polylepis.1